MTSLSSGCVCVRKDFGKDCAKGGNMSVLIKGMEMPTNCGKCKIKNAVECNRWQLVRSVALDRHKDCPLVYVPPHGRLSDADKLCLSSGFSTATEYGMGRSDQIEAIKSNAPTVIPAEEGNGDAE